MRHRSRPPLCLRAELAGKNDSYNVRIAALHPLKQVRSIHARHAHIGDHHIHFLLIQQVERLVRTQREMHVPMLSLRTKHPLQPFEQPRLVVYKKDSCHLASTQSGSGCPVLFTKSCRGSRTTNVVPSPALVSKWMVPP